jgi:hypothetical protein
MMRRLLPFALMSLAACGKADNDAGPGGVSVGEARALDEAAEMVESRRLPDDMLRPPMVPATPASAAKAAPAPAPAKP